MSKRDHSRALLRAQGGATPARLDPLSFDSDGNLRIDATRLAPPSSVYDADLLWAEERHGAVSLFFAKEHLSGKRLRTRVEIRYPYEPFAFHLWENASDFHARLRGFRSKFPQGGELASPESLTAREADREHSDWANFDILSHHGTLACLDFFRLPPAGLAQFARGGGSAGLVLEPILRIHTTAAELCRLLDLCEPIAGRIEALRPPEEAK
jgi:hypothetical protein